MNRRHFISAILALFAACSQQNPRTQTAALDVTSLSAPIDAETPTLTPALQLPNIVPGDYLVLDMEVVKIVAFDQRSGKVRIERGFDGTARVSHAAGTTIRRFRRLTR